MAPRYDEIELAESAYRHGYNDRDVADMVHGPHLVIASRRGRQSGYEIFGRNRTGVYLLAAARVIESQGGRVLSVFHVNRMTDAERRRFLRQVR